MVKRVGRTMNRSFWGNTEQAITNSWTLCQWSSSWPEHHHEPHNLEIVSARWSLKNGKASGHDNLNAELFNTGNFLTATLLPQIFFIKSWKEKTYQINRIMESSLQYQRKSTWVTAIIGEFFPSFVR